MSYILRYQLLFFIIWLLPMIGNSQDPNTPVPYTLADRDRIMRMEQEVNSLRKEMFNEIDKLNVKIEGLHKEMNFRFESVQKQFEGQQKQFESLQRQIDDFKYVFYWFSGIIISLFLVLFGYIIWDRYTFLKPFYQQQINIVASLEKLKNVFIDVGRDNPKIREALNRQGLE